MLREGMREGMREGIPDHFRKMSFEKNEEFSKTKGGRGPQRSKGVHDDSFV